MHRALSLAFLSLFAAACSPIYAFKSAKGHASLLWHRKDLAKAAKDPKIAPGRRAMLELALAARTFGFERMGLERSRDFSTYSEVKRSAVTWLVWGAERTRLKIYEWKFPLIGTFPYKGHYSEADARDEARGLEKKGFDSFITGAAAYNTPLWISDPLPSTALSYSSGTLASIIIHELVHGTVFFKDQVEFNESLATFAGDQGAEELLADRAPASLEAFRRQRVRELAVMAEMTALRERLEALYSGPGSEADKLRDREAIFSSAAATLKGLGYAQGPLNNAAVLANRVYDADKAPFIEAYERLAGKDWRKFFTLMKGLDRKDPYGALKKKVAAGS